MKTAFSLLALCLPITILYGQFFLNPLVFDDFYIIDGTMHNLYVGKLFFSNLRWLPYATFEWTRALFGPDMIWFRLGNLALHLATTITLFLFLRRLFEQTLHHTTENDQTLSPHWLAFFGALIFALHPASVYAEAYLVQRSILMATLFTLLTWRLFLEGVIRKNYRWLLASSVTYFVAVFSKEHAIMAPAVTIALLFLVDNQPIRQRLILIGPTFLLYGLIGGFVILRIKSSHILGQSYEPTVANSLSLLGPDFNAKLTYPLSILTQCYLFFKYLWVWLAPSPSWMSVDISQPIAKSLWSWPEIAGLIGFIAYPVIAIRLLLQKGVKGLLGFALLCPWLLFATELSTIRIQEPFVLYRSYLWMAGTFAALPFLCQKLSTKQATIIMTLIALFLMPISWLRLTTFSHPLLLWDDAARLIENNQEKTFSVQRVFYNRGTELIKVKQYNEAIEDLTKAIRLTTKAPELAGPMYNNRGAAYLETRQYALALDDFNSAIKRGPKNSEPYIGKGTALQALNNTTASAQAYQQACLLGAQTACQKLEKINQKSKGADPRLIYPE